MIGSERIRIKIKVCLPTHCLLRASPEPAMQLSVKRRYSQSLPQPDSAFGPISPEYQDLFVQKQFVIFASPLEHLFDVKVSIQTMYHKLYPEEHPIDIKRLRDQHNCDLDDDFMVGEVLSSGEDSFLAVCEYGVIMNGTEMAAKKSKVEEEIKQPLPVRVTDRCIATPLSTVDDMIRQEAEPLFNSTKDLQVKQVDKIESESEYETETESEESMVQKLNPEPVKESIPDVKVENTIASITSIALETKAESESSEYETDSEEEEIAAEPVVAATLTMPAVIKPASESEETESEEESESESEESESEDKVPQDNVMTQSVVKQVEPVPKKESSSEYETESESSEESEQESEPLKTVTMPSIDAQSVIEKPVSSSSYESSEDDSDFKPTPLSDAAKKAILCSSQPQTQYHSSQPSNKKYGSHLFSANHK